jgi:hypothetical protein
LLIAAVLQLLKKNADQLLELKKQHIAKQQVSMLALYSAHICELPELPALGGRDCSASWQKGIKAATEFASVRS